MRFKSITIDECFNLVRNAGGISIVQVENRRDLASRLSGLGRGCCGAGPAWPVRAGAQSVQSNARIVILGAGARARPWPIAWSSAGRAPGSTLSTDAESTSTNLACRLRLGRLKTGRLRGVGHRPWLPRGVEWIEERAREIDPEAKNGDHRGRHGLAL